MGMNKQKLWKNCLEPCLLGIASIGGLIAGSWFIMQNPVRNCMILTLVLLAVAKIYGSGERVSRSDLAEDGCEGLSGLRRATGSAKGQKEMNKDERNK